MIGRDVMEVYYPLFQQNRILKKEMLWSVRDYALLSEQLAYQTYSEGILQGCEVRIEGKYIVVGTGMIKYGEFICFRMEEERIFYAPSQKEQILKIRFQKKQTEDWIQYQMDLVLEDTVPLQENEFELCRYKLQTGAKLREQYKNLEDMGTEYDILNFISASWGGLEGKTIAPVITKRFAEELLKSENCKQEDLCFAYFCLSQAGALPRKVVLDYIGRKCSCRLEEDISNQRIFEELCRLVRKTGGAAEKGLAERLDRRRIYVD